MALNDDILEDIASQVAHAYYDENEIFETILSCFAELTETDYEDLRRAITNAFVGRAAEARLWPSVTDPDRLFGAFDDVERQGIVAVENCGVTLHDGLGFVAMVCEERSSQGWQGRGFCFFHEQDVMCAMDGDGLALAFGDLMALEGDSSDADIESVGRLVFEACVAHGLSPRWDGSASSRIELPTFRWQCRPRRGNRPPRPM
jgi:hypothetical protein